jgi:hypothetical protein
MAGKLTDTQRRLWQTDGYLHLEGALDPDEVAFFSAEMDRIRALPGYEPDRDEGLPIGHYAWLDHSEDLDPNGFMDRRDLLGYHQGFIDLVDKSPVFEYVLDLMGPNMMLSMTQAIARPPTESFPGYTHTDGGESLRHVQLKEDAPPIAMKAMYLLSDVFEEDHGNLTVFPGSHLRQIPYQGDRTMTPYSPGAAQLLGKAGDVYLFPHSLWHGPSKNLSGKSRKVLLYNYCQLWVRSYDHGVVPDIVQACTPRQRRLLGDLGYDFRPGSYFYVPKDQEEVMGPPSA